MTWQVGHEWDPTGYVAAHTNIDTRGTAKYYKRLSLIGENYRESNNTDWSMNMFVVGKRYNSMGEVAMVSRKPYFASHSERLS